MAERLIPTPEQLKGYIGKIEDAKQRLFSQEAGICNEGVRWGYVQTLEDVKLGLKIALGEVTPVVPLGDSGRRSVWLEDSSENIAKREIQIGWDHEKREITSDFEKKVFERNKPDRPISR